jgi:hypothetical protein
VASEERLTIGEELDQRGGRLTGALLTERRAIVEIYRETLNARDDRADTTII